MKKSSTENEAKVTRKEMRSNIIIILICALAFIGICILTAYSMKHDNQQIIVHAQSKVPYDQILDQETIVFEKEYNKTKDCWETFNVQVYKYKFDGVPGIFVVCDELGQQMDFYGFSSYKALCNHSNFEPSSAENPCFNLIIQKNEDDKNGIYIHPEKETGTFLIVQNIKDE